jgi:hypothetical protein
VAKPLFEQKEHLTEYSKNTSNLSVFRVIEKRIQEAVLTWNALEAQQSKTLSEAIIEYRRRYKREPPSRFDEWYAFAVRHRYVLVDEFNSLNADLKPFRCFNASEFRERLELASQVGSTVTYRIVKGHINLTWHKIPKNKRFISWMDLYKKAFERLGTEASLPDIIFTYSIPHGPRVYVPFASMQQCSSVANRKAKTMNMHHSMRSACPPQSPLNTGRATHPTNPLFRDWSSMTDSCQEPSFAKKHGYVHTNAQAPINTLLPLMSVCKTSHSQDIRIPSPYYWAKFPEYEYTTAQDTNWTDKIFKAYWRGASTGVWSSKFWPFNQRHRLVHFANSQISSQELINVRCYKKGNNKVLETTKAVKRSLLQNTMLNIAFSQTIQCTKKEALRMQRMYKFTQFEPQETAYQHAFVLDVDGNSYSARFPSLLRSNSVVIKSTVFHEWFSELLLPWFHFVPLSLDYSEIYDVLNWFRGTDDGTFSNMGEGHRISIQASKFVKKHLREEDHIVYLYRLLIELADMMGHIKPK